MSGTADDRTFVLAAQRWWNIGHGQAGMPAQNRDNSTPTVFFRLTFHPATGTTQLTRLSAAGKARTQDLLGMGVSPDGTRLALDYYKSVQIVTLATGASRTWTWPGNGGIGNWKPIGDTFSWSADGRYLEFQQWGGRFNETMHVRVLDTRAPGTSLATAKVIVMYPYRSGYGSLVTGNTFLTPDGTKIVTVTTFYQRHAPSGYSQITGYSARTGQPLFHEDRFSSSIGWQEVLWSGPGGNALVVTDPRGKKDSYGGRAGVLGILAGNRFTPIPHGAVEGGKIAW